VSTGIFAISVARARKSSVDELEGEEAVKDEGEEAVKDEEEGDEEEEGEVRDANLSLLLIGIGGTDVINCFNLILGSGDDAEADILNILYIYVYIYILLNI
jgi:hypothetical protein